ncbi:hypothetical protein HF086_007665 [Spodoptera exigua]|uniref:Uncharacterized protein n=1 Tax=Spodoptera exigua TaxID=7107 RepID=A0A922M6X3_SPOEX|nr:hypothetical protein HF086_007665 [Spodoptera exigua]
MSASRRHRIKNILINACRKEDSKLNNDETYQSTENHNNDSSSDVKRSDPVSKNTADDSLVIIPAITDDELNFAIQSISNNTFEVPDTLVVDCSIDIPLNEIEESGLMSKDKYIEGNKTNNKITDNETSPKAGVAVNISQKKSLSTCVTDIDEERSNMTDNLQIPSRNENDMPTTTSPSIFEEYVNNIEEYVTGQEEILEEIVVSSNNTKECNLEDLECIAQDRNIPNSNKNDVTINLRHEQEEIIAPRTASTTQNFEDRDFIPLQLQTPLTEGSDNSGKRPKKKGRKRKIEDQNRDIRKKKLPTMKIILVQRGKQFYLRHSKGIFSVRVLKNVLKN